jgi:hypothetical protein
MGFSLPGKSILKCPMPKPYLHYRDGIFFYVPHLIFAVMGIVLYLCLGGGNIYSPSIKDIFFAAGIGLALVFLAGFLMKVSRPAFFCENGISIPGRSSAFTAYREIAECVVSPIKHWNTDFYILNFTLRESENPLTGILISRVENRSRYRRIARAGCPNSPRQGRGNNTRP